MISLSGVTFVFVLLRFRLCAFVEAAALVRSSFDMQAPRYPGVFISFSLLFILMCRFFRALFVPFPLSLCIGEYVVVRSFFPNGFFLYLVTTDWTFYISLCEN